MQRQTLSVGLPAKCGHNATQQIHMALRHKSYTVHNYITKFQGCFRNRFISAGLEPVLSYTEK